MYFLEYPYSIDAFLTLSNFMNFMDFMDHGFSAITQRRWWFSICLIRLHRVNSLWPSDTIWCQGLGSTLAQVMACCLTVSSQYLNQSKRSCDTQLKAILQEISQSSITKISLKITYLKFYSNLTGANELTVPHVPSVLLLLFFGYTIWPSITSPNL